MVPRRWVNIYGTLALNYLLSGENDRLRLVWSDRTILEDFPSKHVVLLGWFLRIFVDSK